MARDRAIIKRSATAPWAGQGERAAAVEARPTRIPADRVGAHPVAPDDLEETFRWKGILRKGEVPAPMAPYVMVDLKRVSAFPLPEAVSVAAEARPAASRSEAAGEAPADTEAAWKARLEEAVEHTRAEAYEAGYEEGYVAAEAALQASFEHRKEDLGKDLKRLQDAWKTFLKQSEPLMASLAFEVARQLLDAPLPQDVRAVSTQALAQALSQFGEATPLEVSLHPDDHARLQAYGLIDGLEALHGSIRWNLDETIAMGDWIIQSPEAAIRRLKEEMLGQLKSRLGLLAVVKSRESS